MFGNSNGLIVKLKCLTDNSSKFKELSMYVTIENKSMILSEEHPVISMWVLHFYKYILRTLFIMLNKLGVVD